MSDDDQYRDLTFDQIDWEEQSSAGLSLSTRTKAQLVAFGLLGAAFCYDLFVVAPKAPTMTWPFTWDVTGMDWTFMATLLVLFFNGVVPLYQNQRLTKYYWTEFRKNKAAVVSLGYIAVLFVVGGVGPILLSAPEQHFSQMYLPPVGMTASPQGQVVTGTWAHPLGTDARGRDLLKLLVFGARVSLEVGLIGMLVMVSFGTTVGTVAAYFGGWVDEVLMRYTDIQMTFPAFILMLLMVYLFGGSLFMIILLFGVLSWEGTARLIRSEALQKREEAYFKAAESFGASNGSIIRRHLVPNVSSTVITNATLVVPFFILSEASLSFVGLGDPDVISWGQVIASGRSSLGSAPWIATLPGVFLFFTVLAFNYVGDAARDAMDPRNTSE
ncbi:ABC transporter permease [Halospeciosus flavus]|uniref:ABC transporter permease n=2 Tax=Halospeciosus flavus TaxID=3032283 RepID=A0ABD5Z1Z4_9EURY|nr:ABC transporter permease [Halospeciosus flavus]